MRSQIRCEQTIFPPLSHLRKRKPQLLRIEAFEQGLTLIYQRIIAILRVASLHVGVPGFEPGVARTQNENVSRYTTLRCETTISYPPVLSRDFDINMRDHFGRDTFEIFR
jgi:hypothetical protein